MANPLDMMSMNSMIKISVGPTPKQVISNGRQGETAAVFPGADVKHEHGGREAQQLGEREGSDKPIYAA